MAAVKEFRLGNDYGLVGEVNKEEKDRNRIYIDSLSGEIKYQRSIEETLKYLRNRSEYGLEEDIMKALNLPRTEHSFLGGGNGWMILGLTVPGRYIKLLSSLSPDKKFKTLCHEIAHNLRPDVTNEREIDRIGDSISGLVLDLMKNLGEKYAVRNGYN